MADHAARVGFRDNAQWQLSFRILCATLLAMAELAPPDLRDIFENAWESAQRLAIDVIGFPVEMRDAVMQRMGAVLTEIAVEAGCPHEMALEFSTALEESIRAYVEKIEASGGGIIGTA